MRVSKAVNTRWGVKDATVSDRSAASSITQESVPEMGRKEGSEEKGKPESSKDVQDRTEVNQRTKHVQVELPAITARQMQRYCGVCMT